MNGNSCDVVIVGGGVMGCSIAYHLMKAEPKLKVIVIERDPSYQYGSTTLSMGGVRVQFSLKENILISLHALEVLKHFEEEMTVHGIGTISEIYNGNPPHIAKGTISQAWSVAALLQISKMLENYNTNKP